MHRRSDVTVAVAGSGPAGAAAATHLARAGIDVLLIDHRRFPRTKACGEYLNERTVARLAELGIAEQLRPQAARLNGMRLFAHAESVEFPFERELWSLPRMQLDEAIRETALAAGASALTARVVRVESDAGGARVHVRDERGTDRVLQADYVVGADGLHSVVAGDKVPAAPAMRFALGGHYAMGTELDGWIEMFRTPEGYLALNPLAGGTANAMCVVRASALREWRDDVESAMRSFSLEASGGRRELNVRHRVGERVSIGPLMPYERRPVQGRRILAGDAAAFLDPFTGQGIAFALTTASLAAGAVVRALRFADTAALPAYADAVNGLVRERRRVAQLVDGVLQHRFTARIAAARVRESPALVRSLVDLVAGCSRDDSPLLTLTQLAGAALR